MFVHISLISSGAKWLVCSLCQVDIIFGWGADFTQIMWFHSDMNTIFTEGIGFHGIAQMLYHIVGCFAKVLLDKLKHFVRVSDKKVIFFRV